MKKLSIHTATYNRAFTLGKVFDSLKKQTCKDFEWIISDDGSTDNTEDLVKEWLSQDNGFEIIYSKLPHVGLPRAHNNGIKLANTDWFMLLDSDDYLMPETVEKVLTWVNEIKDIPMMAGIGVTRTHPDGTFMKPQQPKIDPNIGYVDINNSDRARYNLDMDCFEATRTALLRKYPFQCWPTEEYAPPALSINEMAMAGWKYRWRIDHLYICEYLSNGITKDNRKVKKNPMGYAMMYNQDLLRFRSFKAQSYNSIQMIALCTYAGHLEYLRKSNAPWVTALVLPIGLIWGIRRKCQFAKMK